MGARRDAEAAATSCAAAAKHLSDCVTRPTTSLGAALDLAPAAEAFARAAEALADAALKLPERSL